MSMLKKETAKNFLLDFVFILGGSISVCYAVAIGMFSAPNNIAPGGLTGVATLLNYLSKGWIDIGTATIVMNIPLIIASWFILNKSMVIRTLCGIVVSSVLTDLVQPYVDELFMSSIVQEGGKDPLLVCIFGGALLGLGVGLIMRRGGTTGGSEVISRLLDGDFMAYDKIITAEVTSTVTVNTRSFIDAVDRVSLVINDRLKSPLVCDFAGDSITVSCTTPLGSANDTVASELVGDCEQMGFNSRFLLDALKNSETDAVKIELNGALKPMKILPTEGDAFLFLVLPVRLKK